MINTIFIEKQDEIDVKIRMNVNIDYKILQQDRWMNPKTNLSTKWTRIAQIG
jgi:hypothetical protein